MIHYMNENRLLSLDQVKKMCAILNISLHGLEKDIIAIISRVDWKYLLRELILYYTPAEMNRMLCVKNTNKTSLYNWLKGLRCPAYVAQRKKLLELAGKIGKPMKLISENRRKENLLLSYKRSVIREKYIDSFALIKNEIIRRRNTSANMWYISNMDEKIINIRYITNTGSGKNVILPRRIELNDRLFKLFGFWLGDGVTEVGKASISAYKSYVSFSSGETDVIENAIGLFKDILLQGSSVFDIEIIYGSAVNPERKGKFLRLLKRLDVRKVVEREHMDWNSLGASINVRNSILAYLFNFLHKEVTNLLECNERIIPFLGGYFTAEGSTSKTNKFFLFHETKEERRDLIKNLLIRLGFCKPFEPRLWHDRIVIAHNKKIRDNDIKLFGKLILPYIFSKRKMKEASDLTNGNYLRDIDLVYLYYLYLHRNMRSDKLCKAFNKSRDHIVRIYRRLEEMSPPLLKRKRGENAITEFYELNLTKIGKKVIERNTNKIKEILKETIRIHKFGKGFRGTFRLCKNDGEPVQAIYEIIQDLSLCSPAALINPLKRGSGSSGLDVSSG